MPEPNEPESHTLRWLRRIDTKLDLLADITRETRDRVGLLEQQVGLLGQQYATIAVRVDRIEDRLERIERRLDLADSSVDV